MTAPTDDEVDAVELELTLRPEGTVLFGVVLGRRPALLLEVVDVGEDGDPLRLALDVVPGLHAPALERPVAAALLLAAALALDPTLRDDAPGVVTPPLEGGTL